MSTPEFGVAEPFLRAGVALVCAYETLAITSRRVPTVSTLARRYPVLGAVVLAALARHFQPLAENVAESVPAPIPVP